MLLLGEQRPRILHVPEFVTSSGQEAIELAALAGLDLDEWQQFVLVNALGEREDGKWAARTVGLTVPRQNGKGSVLEARELFGLFVLGENLINHTAHQQKTATNHFKRMLRLIEGVPEFERRVMKAPTGKGNEAIELRGGQEIFFATRKGGGGRGLTADLQVYDEAMYLTEQDRSSLAPTMAAQSMHGNIQTWYAGSSPDEEDPAQDGVPFAQVRASGVKRSHGVAYFEWSIEGDDPADVREEVAASVGAQAQANPGLGIRISREWIEHERTVEMGARGFAVERLGVGKWPDPSGKALQVLDLAVWRTMLDPGSSIDGPVCFSFDVNPSRSWASISVAGRRADGLGHVEVVDRRPGTNWVVDRLVELLQKHNADEPICDKSGQAASLIPELDERGVTVRALTAGERAQACGTFFDAVGERRFRHCGPDVHEDALTDAVRGAVKRDVGEAWAWSGKSSAVDITPLVSCTFAFFGAQAPTGGEPMFAWG